LCRKGNSTRDQLARLPQRDVHRPIFAAQLGKLAGAVERIDDPHPLGGQSHWVVGALLGQHRIAGPLGSQRLHQEVVGSLVPRRFPLRLAGISQFRAYFEQQLARLRRQPRGDVVVAHRLDSSRSMTKAASSSGVRSGVRRRSGFFGRW
jgi:hypothetical protein